MISVTVTIAVMIVMAALPRLFQLMALLFGLAAVRTMFALCFLQFLLCLVDALLAFSIVPVASLQRCKRGETKDDETSNENSSFQEHWCLLVCKWKNSTLRMKWQL